MQQQMPDSTARLADPMDTVRQQIREAALRRSDAHYSLSGARLRVTQLEALILQCDGELKVLESTQAVLANMTRNIEAQVKQAEIAARPPTLPSDGPPAHITQEAAVRPSKAVRSAKRKATGRPPGRPRGSGRKPQHMHDEVTVAGMNGAGMTPGEAASE